MVSVDVKHHVYLLTSYPLLQPPIPPPCQPVRHLTPTLTHQPICFHHQRPSQSDNSTHTYPSLNLFPSAAAQPVRQLTPTLIHQPICFLHQRHSQLDNSHPHLSINQSVSITRGPASQTTHTHTYPLTNLFPSPAAQPVLWTG